MRRPAALLAALLLAGACTSQDAAPADGAAAGAGAPAAAAAPAASGDGDLADVAGYELTMERLDRYFAAQRAMGRRMRDLSPAEREAMRLQDDDVDDDGSLEAMTSRIEGNAVMRDALREADLSPREFATLTMSLVQASMAAMVVQMRPEADLDSLVREMQANPASVRFVRDNQAAIERKQAELKAEMERLGVLLDDEEGGDEGGDEEDPAA